MSGSMTVQGTTAPAPPPAIPPMPARPGAGTGATAAPATSAQQAAQQAADAAQAAAQAAADAVRQEIQVQTGQPEILIPPPYRRGNDDIPPEVIPLVSIVFGTLAAIVLGYPIIRLITRVIERKTDNGALAAKDVTAQLRALQESIDTMAIELERISEGQRFTAKLMAEREQRALAQGEGQSR